MFKFFIANQLASMWDKFLFGLHLLIWEI